MATAYLGLVQMFSEFGLGSAINQRRSLTPGQIARLGGVSAISSTVLAAISVAVAGLVAAFFAGSDGGFGSIEAVRALFQSDALLVAGWLHYLAFDLFVGAWEVRTARTEGIRHLLVIPCLVLTFLFGPLGFLTFLILRAACARRMSFAMET